MNSLNLAQSRRAVHAYDAQSEHRTQAFSNSNVECANPQCSRTWLAFLKDRRRPMFEGRWGCCAKCLEVLAGAAIRRESGESTVDDDESGHHHRMPLGLILLARGWITNSQLRHALDLQRRARSGRIGDWLIDQCGLTQQHITWALSMQWGCPILPMDDFNPVAMALAVPRLLMETTGVVPLRIAGRRILYLAFADQPDASAAFAIERMSGLTVQSGLADPTDWAAARQRIYACDVVDATFERVASIDDLSRTMTSSLAGIQPRASRLVRVHGFYWLRMWLETGAMTSLGGGMPVSKEDVVDRLYTIGTEH